MWFFENFNLLTTNFFPHLSLVSLFHVVLCLLCSSSLDFHAYFIRRISYRILAIALPSFAHSIARCWSGNRLRLYLPACIHLHGLVLTSVLFDALPLLHSRIQLHDVGPAIVIRLYLPTRIHLHGLVLTTIMGLMAFLSVHTHSIACSVLGRGLRSAEARTKASPLLETPPLHCLSTPFDVVAAESPLQQRTFKREAPPSTSKQRWRCLHCFRRSKIFETFFQWVMNYLVVCLHSQIDV